MTDSYKQARPVILLLLAIAIITTGIAAYLSPPFDPDTYCCDHLFYRSMAFNLFEVTRPEVNVPPPENRLWEVYDQPYQQKWLYQANELNRQPPYVYRVVAPLVARGIGWLFFGDDVRYGFYALSFLALTMASFLMSLTLYLTTRSAPVALLGLLVFAANKWTLAFNLNDYMLPDALAFGLLSLAVLFMLRQMRLAFFLTCLVGLFVKETFILLIPSYLLYETLRRNLSRFSVVSAVLLAGLYGLFRVAMPVPVNTYSLATTFYGMQPASVLHVASTFGILTFFTLSRLWLSRFTISLIPLGVGSLAFSFFATDVARSIIYSFPLVIFSVLGNPAAPATSRTVRILAVAPAVVYLCLEIIQSGLGLKGVNQAVFLVIEFAIFVLLETAFWRQWLRYHPTEKSTG